MLSSFTRNIALGSASTTSPSNSTFSSFGIAGDSISETGTAAGGGGRRYRFVVLTRRRSVAGAGVPVPVPAVLFAEAVLGRAGRGGGPGRARAGGCGALHRRRDVGGDGVLAEVCDAVPVRGGR